MDKVILLVFWSKFKTRSWPPRVLDVKFMGSKAKSAGWSERPGMRSFCGFNCKPKFDRWWTKTVCFWVVISNILPPTPTCLGPKSNARAPRACPSPGEVAALAAMTTINDHRH